MCWMDGFLGQPDNVRHVYDRYRAGFVDRWLSEAARYVQDAEGREVRHEGMIAIPGRVAVQRPRGSVWELLRAEYSYRTSAAAEDNHVESPLLLQAQRRILTPVRRLRVSRYLAPRYVSAGDLPGLDYVFYPLHAEPEVALSIHGRAYVESDQETVRNLARSLPAGMIIVTKEHPRSIGYRPPRYYDKLLRIPNVRIADPHIESSHLVRHSAAVAAVWSFVGFEEACAQTGHFAWHAVVHAAAIDDGAACHQFCTSTIAASAPINRTLSCLLNVVVLLSGPANAGALSDHSRLSRSAPGMIAEASSV